MWNQSQGASIGALLQSLAQNNPQVFQAIMQMVAAQRQQGVGGIGSLPSRGGMSPRGDNSMIGGPMPMGPQQGGNPAMTPAYGGFLGQAPQWYMERAPGSAPYSPPSYVSPMPGWPTPGQGGAATGIPGVGAGSSGMNPQQPTGPKYMPPQQPYAQPTGPKYAPPTGPKPYGQTMPAEPPPFVAPQPKPPMQPSYSAGDGASGLDWYASQAGN